MLRKLGVALGALGLVTGGLALGTPAQAHDVRVGVMTCDMASGFGYILGSSRDLHCTFSPAAGFSLPGDAPASYRTGAADRERAIAATATTTLMATAT